MTQPNAPQYPHMLRTANCRWWHPLGGTALLLLVWFVPVAMVAQVLPTDPDRSDTAAGVAAASLILALLLPAAFVAAMLVHRIRPAQLLSATGRPRVGMLAVAAAVATPAFVPMMLAKTAGYADEADSAGWVGWQAFLPLFLVIVLVFPFQAAAEEVLFRGYLTQAIAIWTRRALPAVAASSLMFVGVHRVHDLWSFADYFFFALAMCWLTWRTGGLEAAIAVHIAYNLLLGLALAATGQVGALTTGRDCGVLGSLTSIGGTVLVVLALSRCAAPRSPVAAPIDTEREAAYR